MSNDLEVAKQFEIVITNEQKELVRRTIAPDATDAELQLFFYDCTRRGVHPLDKLIHFTKRSGKYTPITSIDMFRMRAAESGEHMGTDDAVYISDAGKPDFSASVTVYRRSQGEKCSYTATARWSEYFPGEAQGFMWKKMPHLMLAKCAEALALRKAFPQQLHGLYTPEEMAQAEAPLRPTIPQVRPQSKPEDGAGDSPHVSVGNTQQASDAPAQSAAEFARRKAEEMSDDPHVDGFVTNWQPYSGTKRNEKGKRPGQFDLDDGQETIVMKWIKYFDPHMEEQLKSGGLKRVFYKEDTYNGKTQYQAVKVESVE